MFLISRLCPGAFASNSCTKCSNLNATIKDMEDRESLIKIDLENIFKADCGYSWSEVCDSSSTMKGQKNKFVFEIKISKPLPDNLQIFVWCGKNEILTLAGIWSRNSAGKLYFFSFVITFGKTHYDCFQ